MYERAQARVRERKAAAHKVQVLGDGTDEDVVHVEVCRLEENLGPVDDGDGGQKQQSTLRLVQVREGLAVDHVQGRNDGERVGKHRQSPELLLGQLARCLDGGGGVAI